MRVIANKLPNVNTTGFKRDRATFATLGYQQMTAAGATSEGDARLAVGQARGTGIAVAGTARIDTQGTLTSTGNALDVAIDGAGDVQVALPAGAPARPARATCR